MGLFSSLFGGKSYTEKMYEQAGAIQNSTSPSVSSETSTANGSLVVEDVFDIKGRGLVLTGKISVGTLKVGQSVSVSTSRGNVSVEVTGLEALRQTLQVANPGINVGVLISGPVTKSDIIKGGSLTW